MAKMKSNDLTTKQFNNSNKGFTLMEMIVAIAIFSLLATMILPNLNRWYASIKLNGTLRDMISDIRVTQQKAVSSQTNHLLRIDEALNSYSIVKTGTPEEILQTKILPSGIAFNNVNLAPNPTEIEFNPAGAPNSNGTIVLANPQSNTKTIEVTPSGFVKEI